MLTDASIVGNTQPLWRRSLVSSCSLGFCLCILSWVVVVLMPLQLAYLSDGLWRVDEWHWEQPEVAFLDEVLVVADGTRVGVDGSSRPVRLSWSSQRASSAVLEGETRPCVVRARSEDDFGDGRPDRLFVRVSLPLSAGEVVRGVALQGRVRGRFHNRARVESDGLVHVQASGGVGGRGVVAVGRVGVVQRNAVPVSAAGYYVPNLEDPLWDLSDPSPADIAPAATLKRHASRNFTFALTHTDAVWQAETDFVPSLASSNGEADSDDADTANSYEPLAAKPRHFEVELTIHIPPTPLWIQPALSTVLKDAWQQYLSLFVPVFLAVWWIVSTLFDSGAIYSSTSAQVISRTKME